MLYQAYQMHDDLLGPVRQTAKALYSDSLLDNSSSYFFNNYLHASFEMISRFKLTHLRPNFNIPSVQVDNREIAIDEKIVVSQPFGNLVHFDKNIDAPQPKILVVAPLSGHFSTLLRGTVQTLLEDHDVYITDWKNARDVPLAEGAFDVEDYVGYIIRFLEYLGPTSNVLAVCQPCVQTLIAVAVMSQEDNPATPRSMTLMAGPIDTRESPTRVNQLAATRPLEWFRNNVISTVPVRHGGGSRRVYPGFVQLSAFMAMNMDRHGKAHQKLYFNLAAGNHVEAQQTKDFYDEYFAVLDLTEEFYLGTIDRIFKKAELAEGKFTYRGRTVEPRAIRKTALLTVEGGRDDICALGQTSAAHDLCSSLRPHLKQHHLQANVGHYGVFNGKHWRREIYPQVRNMILAME